MSDQTTSEHIAVFKEWVSTIREDIETLKAVVSSPQVDKEARCYAAGALNYLITRMDLVPDWEESVGVMDDVMVIRLCLELASQHGLDDALEDSDHIVAVGRLLNEARRIEAFLGSELHAELRKHCARLTDQVVRGRGVAGIVDSEEEQQQLFSEVEADLKRMPPAAFADPEALAVKFKSYLHHKLST